MNPSTSDHHRLKAILDAGLMSMQFGSYEDLFGNNFKMCLDGKVVVQCKHHTVEFSLGEGSFMAS